MDSPVKPGNDRESVIPALSLSFPRKRESMDVPTKTGRDSPIKSGNDKKESQAGG